MPRLKFFQGHGLPFPWSELMGVYDGIADTSMWRGGFENWRISFTQMGPARFCQPSPRGVGGPKRVEWPRHSIRSFGCDARSCRDARGRKAQGPMMRARKPHLGGTAALSHSLARVKPRRQTSFPIDASAPRRRRRHFTGDARSRRRHFAIALTLTIEVGVAIAFAAAWFTWQQVGESRAV